MTDDALTPALTAPPTITTKIDPSPQEYIDALKRLDPYLIKLRTVDKRERLYKLNAESFVADMRLIMPESELIDLQRCITTINGVPDVVLPAQKRRLKGSHLTNGVDTVRERDRLRRRKTKSSVGNMLIGHVSFEDLDRLAPVDHNNPDNNLSHLHVAALVYVLVKSGVLVWRNLDRPENQALMTQVRRQVPHLHLFLMADHYAKLRDNYPSLYYVNPARPIGERVTAENETFNSNKSDPMTPSDYDYQTEWEALLDPVEFQGLASALDTFLRHCAEITHIQNPVRPLLQINFNIVKERIGVGHMTPMIWGNPINSQYALNSLNYSRVALGTSIGRHDLWAVWRGDTDRRYYGESGRYATRGSKNRLFGWMAKRVDMEIRSNVDTDMNPYYLLGLGLRMVEEQKPYQRSSDFRSAWDRVTQDTPPFDTQLGEFAALVRDSAYAGETTYYNLEDHLDPLDETIDGLKPNPDGRSKWMPANSGLI